MVNEKRRPSHTKEHSRHLFLGSIATANEATVFVNGVHFEKAISASFFDCAGLVLNDVLLSTRPRGGLKTSTTDSRKIKAGAVRGERGKLLIASAKNTSLFQQPSFFI